jgi:hypothetical protein
MNEMMAHFFSMPPQMQSYYQKNGMMPFPYGMAPHPAFFQMPMPG